MMFHRLNILLLLLCSAASTLKAQQTAVVSEINGNKVYLTIDPAALSLNLDTLFGRVGQVQGSVGALNWSDVLSNGMNPGVDVNFAGFDATGLGSVAAAGTLTADSLVLNKDGVISGRLQVIDAVQLGDSLEVTGQVTLQDDLKVVQSAFVGDRLEVVGVTALGDSLMVWGHVAFNQILEVAGAAYLASTLDVDGLTTLGDSLHVAGGVDFDAGLNVDGATNLDGVTADGNLDLNGNGDVSGTLNVEGLTTLGDSLHVAGGVDFDAGLNVDGATNLDGVTADGNLDLNGNGDVSGTLNVDGLTTLGDSLHVAGGVDLDAGLNVDGATNLDGVTADGNLDLNGNGDVSGTLNVDGLTTLGDSLHVAGGVDLDAGLNVDGATILDGVTADGNLDLNGNGDVSGTLNVDGLTTLGDSLHVAGNSHLAGDLQVDGNTNLGGTLNVTGVSSFADSVHIGGNVSVAGTLEVLDLLVSGDNFMAFENTDALPEGDTNLYFTADQEALLMATYNLLNDLIDELFDPAAILTQEVQNILATTADLAATFDAGGAEVDSAGFVLYAATSPSDSTVYDVVPAGASLAQNLSGLQPGTQYAYRAFIRTLLGREVGTLENFTTLDDAAVNTLAAANLETDGFTLQGELTSDGGGNISATGFRYSLNADLSDSTIVAGDTLAGTFVATLDGIDQNTTVYYQAFATNELGTFYGTTQSETTLIGPCNLTTTETYNGYTYDLVEIGDQCWFAENLRTTLYANGTSIPTVTNKNSWETATYGAQCIYNNNSGFLAGYGRLYNWYAVNNSNGLCPVGWHVPSDDDFMELERFIGMDSAAVASAGDRGAPWGLDLKASPSDNPSWNGSNIHGFSAVAGGIRTNFIENEGFAFTSTRGIYWSSTENTNQQALYRGFLSTSSGITRAFNSNKWQGLSVRCLQDN